LADIHFPKCSDHGSWGFAPSTRLPDEITITGSEGAVVYTAGLALKNPTIQIPMIVQNFPGESFRISVVIDGNLTLNSTLTLAAEGSSLAFTDDGRPSSEKMSHLQGSGKVVMAVFDPNPFDNIGVSSHSIGSSNSLTIQSGITIEAGKGSITSGGELRIRGTIVDQHGQLTVGPLTEDE
jgi:hypothetical protein